MNVQTIGAFPRPKLSLPFGKRPSPAENASGRHSATLSGHELRRLVAAMID